jgi:hypothetical protein
MAGGDEGRSVRMLEGCCCVGTASIVRPFIKTKICGGGGNFSGGSQQCYFGPWEVGCALLTTHWCPLPQQMRLCPKGKLPKVGVLTAVFLPNLNQLDFSIGSVLECRLQASSHKNFAGLHAYGRGKMRNRRTMPAVISPPPGAGCRRW